jgi:hypothetical protein
VGFGASSIFNRLITARAQVPRPVAVAILSAANVMSHRRPPPAIEPLRDLAGVESDEPTHLEVWHTSFGDQAAHVADSDAQSLAELLDAHEFWDLVGVQHVSPFGPLFTSGPKLQPPLLLDGYAGVRYWLSKDGLSTSSAQ